MSKKFTQQLTVVISLVTGGLFLFALRGPAVRNATLLRPAVGQEIVAARPIDPDRRKKDRAALEEEQQRAIRDKVSQAKKLLSQGLVGDVEKILQDILKTDPENRDALKLKDKLVETRDRVAREEVERKQKAQEAAQKQKFADADKLAKKKDYDGALKLVGEILKDAPDSSKAKDRMTLWQSRKAAAERDAKLAQIQGQLDALEAQAEKAVKEKNFDAARQATDKMLSLDPQNRDAKKLSAKIDSERKEAAEKMAEARIDAALEQAAKLADEGKNQEALAKLKSDVLKADPDNPKALKLISAIDDNIANAAARAEFEKALSAAASAEKAGSLEDAMGKYEAAAALAKRLGLSDEYRSASSKERDLRTALKDQLAAKEKAREAEEAATAQQAQALVADGKFDEAVAMLNAKLADPKFADSRALKSLADNIATSREELMAEAREKRAEATLANAQAALEAGDVEKAKAILKTISPEDSPSVARRAERMLERDIPAYLAKAEKEKERQLAEKVDAIADAANALVKQGQYDEALQSVRNAAAGPELKGNTTLQELIGEIAEAKAEAEQEKKIAAAEAQLDAAEALMNAGDIAKAEDVLKKIDTTASKSVAARVARAMERELPKARESAAENRRKAKAETAEATAKGLLNAGEVDKAEAHLKSSLADADLKDNSVLRGLLADIGSKRAEIAQAAEERAKKEAAMQAEIARKAKEAEAAKQREAKLKQSKDSYEAALALIQAGKLDAAERALKAIQPTGTALDAKIAQALDKDIPEVRRAAELVKGEEDLKRAEELAKAGGLEAARELAESVKGRFPELGRDADRLLGRMTKLRQEQQRAQEREVMSRVDDLLKANRVKEAETLIDRFLAGPLKGNEALLSAKSKIESKYAELEYAKGKDLFDKGDVLGAQKVLQDIVAPSRAIASKIDRLLNFEIPRKVREIRTAEGERELAKAEGLLADKKFTAARNMALGIKASFPAEVGKSADSFIEDADDAVEMAATALIKNNDFEGADKLLAGYLEGADEDQAKGVRRLAASIPEIKAKQIETAQTREMESALKSAEALIEDGQFDAAEQAIEKMLSNADIPRAIAVQALGAQKQIAAARDAERAKLARKQLADIEKLIQEQELQQAAQRLNVFEQSTAGFEREVRGLRKDLDNTRKRLYSKVQKEALNEVERLVDEGRYDDALKAADGFLAKPEQAGNTELAKLRDEIPVMKSRILAAEAKRKAESQVKDVERMVEADQLDEAEALLKQIDTTVSDDVERRVARLSGRIPALRDGQTRRLALSKAEMQVREAEKLFAAEKYDEAEAVLKQIDTTVSSDVEKNTEKLAVRIPLARDARAQTLALAKSEAQVREAETLVQNDSLDQAEALLKQIDTTVSRGVARSVEKLSGEIPQLREGQAKRVAIRAAEGRLDEARALVGQEKFDDAEKLLAAIDTSASKDIGESADRLAAAIARARQTKARVDAENAAAGRLDEAEALLKQNRYDDAERLLAQVDANVSRDASRRKERLQADLLSARDRNAEDAAKARLDDARKALAAGDTAAARTAADEAAGMHPSVRRDAEKLKSDIVAQASDAEKRARGAQLVKAEELYKAGENAAALEILDQLDRDGFFPREVKRLRKQAERAGQVTALPPVSVAAGGTDDKPAVKSPYSDKVTDLLKAGDQALVEKDVETAKAAYEAALVWEPQNPVALQRLGQIQDDFVKLKNEAKVKEQQEVQEEVTSTLRESYKNKEKAGDLAGALKDLEQVLKVFPKDADARREFNRIDDLKKRRKRAMDVATDAQRKAREALVTNWLNMARGHLANKEPDKAQAVLNRVIALHGRSEETDFLLVHTDRVRKGLDVEAVVQTPGVTPGVDPTVEPGTTPVTPEVVDTTPKLPPEGVDMEEWQKAQQLLAQIGEAELIQKQERDFKINSLCDEAEKALEIGNFPKANELLEDASKEDKEDERVKSLRAKLRILTGTKGVEPVHLLEEKEEERRVRIEMNIAEMEKLYEAGNSFLANKEYDEAIDRYENSRTILRTLPDMERLTVYRTETAEKLALARQAKQDEEGRIRELQQQQATQLLTQQRLTKSNQQRRQREELLSRARAQMEEENYGLAEDYVTQLLNIDPLNAEARGLLSQLDRARRWDRSTTARRRAAENTDELMIQTDEAARPITSLFEYPDNWQEIVSKRRIGSSIAQDEPEWKKAIREQMEKRISFDFVDTPLADVVAFLTNLTSTNIVLDPAAVEGDDVPVTLKVSDMKLAAALDWILRLVNLTYALRDEAVFISTPDRVAEKVILRLYDVRDLLAVIPDYAGAGLPGIGDGGDGGGGGGDLFGDDAGGDGERFTGEDLVEFISETVSPSSWGGGDEFGDDDEGGGPSGTIAYRSGQLVVTQTPDNHRQIEDLLSLFRESARVQVHITARFIEVSEGFVRSIGMNWNQLDFTNVSSRFDPDPATPGDTDLATTITNSVGSGAGLFGAPLAGFAGTIFYRTDVLAQIDFQLGKESSEVNTLLAPELTCFNGQQARIAVVTEQRYLEDAEVDTVQGTGGSAGFSTIDPEIGTIEEGVNFLVRPTVSSDKRYVTLDLQPQVNDIVSIGTLNLTLDVDPNTGTPVVAPIQLPAQSVKLIQTSVAVPDGGTLMIGGLIDTEDRYEKSTVPFLDRIPVISGLIGQRNKQRLKRYLLILVKAQILIRDEMEPPDAG